MCSGYSPRVDIVHDPAWDRRLRSATAAARRPPCGSDLRTPRPGVHRDEPEADKDKHSTRKDMHRDKGTPRDYGAVVCGSPTGIDCAERRLSRQPKFTLRGSRAAQPGRTAASWPAPSGRAARVGHRGEVARSATPVAKLARGSSARRRRRSWTAQPFSQRNPSVSAPSALSAVKWIAPDHQWRARRTRRDS